MIDDAEYVHSHLFLFEDLAIVGYVLLYVGLVFLLDKETIFYEVADPNEHLNGKDESEQNEEAKGNEEFNEQIFIESNQDDS